MEKIRMNVRENVNRKYRLRDRQLSSTGELGWPLYLAIERIVRPTMKSFQALTQEVLLKRYAPVAVLVDQAGNLLYIHGHTGLYLEPAQGYAGVNNVLRMAKRKLRRDLNIILRKAVTKQEVIESPELSVKKNGETLSVKLTVIPLPKKVSMDQSEDLYLIIFNQKSEQVEPPVVLALQNELIIESQMIQEIERLQQSLVSKEMEITQINSELENVKIELEMKKIELTTANQELSIKKEALENLDSHSEIQTNEMPFLSQTAISEAESLFMDEVNGSDAQDNEQNFDSELFSIALETSTINDKGMGFFSKHEQKSFNIPPKSLAFGQGSDPITKAKTNEVLKFEDVHEFQTAAAHGFRHDNEIKSVIIPEGVEVIKRSMFYKCTQLQAVIFPGSLKIIEDFAFYGCEKLAKAAFENCRFLEIIGTSAFEGCTAISELVIPDSVIGIEEAAFLGCTGIETVIFQDDSQLEVLGSHTFKECTGLTEIILPDQLKHIGISCFYGCQSLSKIHLSKELQTVGEYAFWGCDSLSEIEIANKKILKQPGFSVGFPEGIKL